MWVPNVKGEGSEPDRRRRVPSLRFAQHSLVGQAQLGLDPRREPPVGDYVQVLLTDQREDPVVGTAKKGSASRRQGQERFRAFRRRRWPQTFALPPATITPYTFTEPPLALAVYLVLRSAVRR